MAQARIVITQAGVVGQPGRSRDDIVTGQPVILSNANDNGVTSWRWTLLSRPKGSAATLSNVVAAQPTFTPDVEGTYLVRLEVNQGLEGEVATALVAVRNPSVALGGVTYDTRYPAASENDEANWISNWANPGTPNDTGWWEDLDQWLHLLYATAAQVAGGGGGGGLTGFSNVGTGAGIGRSVTGATLDLRTITSSDGSLTVTENPDEVDLVVATVPLHAPTHEAGGSDPLTLENLATGETNTARVLVPDGSGGVVWTVDYAARFRFLPQQLTTTPPVLSIPAQADEGYTVADTAGAPSTVQVQLPAIGTLSPGRQVGIYLPVGNPQATVEFVAGDPSDLVADFDGNAAATATYVPGTFAAGGLIVLEAVQYTAGGAPSNVWVPRYDRRSAGAAAGTWDQVLTNGRFAVTQDPELQEPRKLVHGTASLAGGLVGGTSHETFRSAEWTSPGGSPPPLQDIGAAIADSTGKPNHYVVLTAVGHVGVRTGGSGAMTAVPFVLEEHWLLGSLVASYRKEGSAAFSAGSALETLFRYSGGQYTLAVRGSNTAGDVQYVAAHITVRELWGPNA